MKAYLFANKDNTIFISQNKPMRYGKTTVKNGWGIKHEYVDSKGNLHQYKWKVNAFKDEDADVEVYGYYGITNELWDHGDDKLLGNYSITKDECYMWSVQGNKMEITEFVCKKLWNIVPTWDDEPIEVEF